MTKTIDALVEALESLLDMDVAYKRGPAVEDAVEKCRAALAQARAEQAEPVKFLANGTRFKMAFFDSEEDGCGNVGTYVTCFEGFDKELDGRWVALVAAEDDCHLKLTTPPAAPVAKLEPLSEDEIWNMRATAKADPQCEKEHWFVLLVRLAEAAHNAKLGNK